MTLNQLLAEISARRIQLRQSGDELLLRGSEACLDKAIVGELRTHKPALLRLIGGDSEHWWSPATAITPDMLPLVTLTQEQIESIVQLVPGGAANIKDIYPLAPLQEGIHFHHLLAKEGDPYLLAALVSFADRPSLDRYIDALQAAIDRHDILRTAVLWAGLPESVQVVWRKARLVAEQLQLSEGDGDIAAQLYARFDPRQYRMDIQQAPLLRAYLAYDEPKKRWLMILLMHHLIGDHTTLDILQGEIQLHLLGQPELLAEPLPFRNVVAQALLGISRQQHESFFRELLGDVEEPTAPFGLFETQHEGRGVREARMQLETALVRRLRECARRFGITVATLAHVAWGQVLARVSGHQDVVFGTVLFGRMQAGTGADQILGPLVNTLPVRIRIGKVPTADCVRSTHELLGELVHHEHASLALAQRCSKVSAPVPLFSSLLNYRHSDTLREPGLEQASRTPGGAELLYIEERTNYPLTLSIDDLENSIGMTALTDALLDPLRVCHFMAKALDCLADRLESEPSVAIEEIDVLPESERSRALGEWNAAAHDVPQDECVHSLFEAQAQRTPDAVAVVDGSRSFTYAELDCRANRMAHHLMSFDIGPGDFVATLLERSFELIIAQLAILKCGAAYLPLDLDYPEDRKAVMLKDSGAKALICTGKNTLPQCESVRTILMDDTVLRQGNADPVIVPVPNAAVAYVMYTSGSTGQPHGVMVPHVGITRLVCDNRYACFLPEDRVAFAANPAFDASTMEVWAPLLNGGRVVVISREILLDPNQFREALERERVTVLWLTVGLFNQYWETIGSAIARLRILMVGGDALDPTTIARTLRQNPPQHLLNGYGPTETTTFAATHEILAVLDNARSIPIGKPIGNTVIYILDARGRLAPARVAGEIYIGGAGLAHGYMNQPALTAERFVPDPFAHAPGSRMYKTGDLGMWSEDGSINFLGRLDHQVKIRGYRIEPGEIETAIRSFSGVAEAVVLVADDHPGEKRLAGFVVAELSSGSLSLSDLRGHLKRALPEYMLPSSLQQVEHLPLTPNGKIDRKALLQMQTPVALAKDFLPPRTAQQELLAEIFAEVLGCARIGIEDDFFELGGHSLLATSVISRVRSVFGVEIPVRALFESPTVAALDLRLKEADGSAQVAVPVLMRRPRDRMQRPSFAQQRLWFLDQLVPGDVSYNVAGAVRIEGTLDIDALQKSFGDIIRRHESLRTRFEEWDGEPVQIVDEVGVLDLELVALEAAGDEEFDTLVRRSITAQARTPFDLSIGPLLRVRVFRRNTSHHVLLLVMHHIITDGWSMGVLLKELTKFYEAHTRGCDPCLPDLPAQYGDYCNWEREWLTGPVLENHLAFWKEELAGLEPLELPIDHGRPAIQSSRGAQEPLQISRDLAAKLKTLARSNGATMYMTLLAAFQILLQRYTGQSNFAVGSPVAGRKQVETESLIGLFVNTLVLRTRLEEHCTFRQLLQRVKETTLRAYAHQDLPFEKLVEALAPQRDLARTPLFQVMFVLQNTPPASLRLGDSRLSAFLVDSGTAKFELTLSLAEAHDAEHGLDGVLEYNSDLFDPTTVRQFAAHYIRLLEAIAENPDQPVRTLELLSVADREQLLVQWNRTGSDPFHRKCVHQLFEQQVARTPDAVALIHDGVLLTYGELNRRANQLAHHLRHRGAQPESRVGICLPRTPEMVIAMLAVLKTGAAYVPLDPAYPTERLRFVLEDAEALLLITNPAGQEAFSPGSVNVLNLDQSAKAIAQESTHDPGSVIDPENLCWIIYTSGSTGRPKGVMIRHSSAAALVSWAQREFSPEELGGVLASTSICFDLSTFELFVPLAWGGAVILAANALQLPSLPDAPRVRLLNTVPSAMTELVRLQNLPSGILTVNLAGEVLQSSLVEQIQESSGTERVVNLYGPSETTTYSTCSSLVRESSSCVTIGRPISGTTVYVLDDDMQPVPLKVKGELYIGGAGVARGYLNRPALTAEKFVPNPFSAELGDRLYRTGDIVRYRSDGTLEFLGRRDHQVKMRGYRIEPGEIEAALLGFPEVERAVVVLREDRAGDKRLVAYLVLTREVRTLDAMGLRSRLREHLPEYMIPSALVQLDALPLNSNGKVDRARLPRVEERLEAQPYVGPRTGTEVLMCAIWEDVLGLSKVGVFDNFFTLGGNSLLVVRLAARIKKTWGQLLALSTIFAEPTVAALARLVERQQPATFSSLVQLRSGESSPLFFVHPVGGNVICYADLAWSLEEGRPIYALQARGLNPTEAPQTSIEEMAQSYLRNIRSVQAGGPYFLAGWSLGGLVALEIAQHLRRAGEEVALLALIDTRTPAQMALDGLQDRELMRQFAVDLGAPSTFLEASADVLDLADTNAALRALVSRARTARLLSEHDDFDFIRRLFDVFATNFKAARQYRPQFYSGCVTLFKAEETTSPGTVLQQEENSTYGWAHLATELVTHTVLGNHYSIIRKPNVENLAALLNQALHRGSPSPVLAGS